MPASVQSNDVAPRQYRHDPITDRINRILFMSFICPFHIAFRRHLSFGACGFRCQQMKRETLIWPWNPVVCPPNFCLDPDADGNRVSCSRLLVDANHESRGRCDGACLARLVRVRPKHHRWPVPNFGCTDPSAHLAICPTDRASLRCDPMSGASCHRNRISCDGCHYAGGGRCHYCCRGDRFVVGHLWRDPGDSDHRHHRVLVPAEIDGSSSRASASVSLLLPSLWQRPPLAAPSSCGPR
mmetsp:Transcript_4838/g.13972  ORF Transcript_4838/g.13972 Transcript_4838/m.13972 type:complete len:240 (-) Transcript_4838:469-1188(-)